MMKRRIASVLALAALIVCAALTMGATIEEFEAVTKQVGGSTGDSVTAAADTSSWVLIPRETTGLYFVAMCDSAMRYTVQVSPDTTHWYTIVADSITAGQAEATTDFGSKYADMSVRIIQDMIPAGGAAFGRTYYVRLE